MDHVVFVEAAFFILIRNEFGKRNIMEMSKIPVENPLMLIQKTIEIMKTVDTSIVEKNLE